ncbi:cation:proton antiporter [Kocuria flava]|uniref:Cation:proton antiporter n=2 Tax=Kocuria flava TaxID=446860 RepID=A0A0U2YZK9_9MICC|nr:MULTISPECIES: monovalent cation/H+ antiporter complex subunit F [Kocuria]ALU40913.1 cation:proton antiporter [Kocuria flava]MCD1146101.1 monovalent cation/H+ antiporter complex subunit F [Kocuria sp. LUK]MCJ8505331.1 monovalent cation/H+ antiporter complex subunit F [Kocuria flava]
MMEIAVGIAAVLLSLGAAGTLYRLAKGPSLLDRVVATDVLLAIVAAALAVDMAYHGHLDNLVLMVIVSLVGFIGSVTVARFATQTAEHGR